MKIDDNAPVFLHTDLDKWKPCLMEQKVRRGGEGAGMCVVVVRVSCGCAQMSSHTHSPRLHKFTHDQIGGCAEDRGLLAVYYNLLSENILKCGTIVCIARINMYACVVKMS